MWKPKAIRSKTIEKTLKRSELLNPIVSASSERMRDALKCLVFKFLYANNLQALKIHVYPFILFISIGYARGVVFRISVIF
jgi:hypothetical protein